MVTSSIAEHCAQLSRHAMHLLTCPRQKEGRSIAFSGGHAEKHSKMLSMLAVQIPLQVLPDCADLTRCCSSEATKSACLPRRRADLAGLPLPHRCLGHADLVLGAHRCGGCSMRPHSRANVHETSAPSCRVRVFAGEGEAGLGSRGVVRGQGKGGAGDWLPYNNCCLLRLQLAATTLAITPL